MADEHFSPLQLDIRHPDLLWVGRRTAMVGLTGDPGQSFYQRAVKVDFVPVMRVEPLEATPQGNGSA